LTNDKLNLILNISGKMVELKEVRVAGESAQE